VNDGDPSVVTDRIHARCEKRTTTCGDGRMVWRIWGEGEPVVFLHGGSGSWTHWIRNLPAFEDKYRLYVADIPGFGDSDLAPREYDVERLPESTDHLAEIVCQGLSELLPPPARYHLVGFSFGSVMGGYVARREGARLASFTLIGAAALGVPWPGLTNALRTAKEGMSREEVMDVQRYNLNAIMMATPPADIDDYAVWLQMENVRRARMRSHVVAGTDTLSQTLPDIVAPMTVIWGAEDVFAKPGLADRQAVFRSVQPDVAIHLLDDVGHWAMYEAAEPVNDLLQDVLKRYAIRGDDE
jgi:pimeloyl-ACP methyl ester carboxylesterase